MYDLQLCSRQFHEFTIKKILKDHPNHTSTFTWSFYLNEVNYQLIHNEKNRIVLDIIVNLFPQSGFQWYIKKPVMSTYHVIEMKSQQISSFIDTLFHKKTSVANINWHSLFIRCYKQASFYVLIPCFFALEMFEEKQLNMLESGLTNILISLP